ncbi:MAG TPA: amidohydrolase family protein [Rhizomicrobium sp.]|nr:amidohydrolase family protein [Rhizomicrobium sp.]
MRRYWKCGAAAAALLALLPTGSLLAQGQSADLLIKGGTIYDGSEGNKGYVGDVAVSGDRIVYVGPHASVTAKRTINAKGKIVSPGFIDTHAHPDSQIYSPDPQLRQVPNWIMQGATTLVLGVDGAGIGGASGGLVHSGVEIKDTFAKFTQQGIGPNVLAFVGYAPIRERVIGEEARAPTAAELLAEKQLVAKGMCEGAWGFSTGLWYTPQFFAKTDELIELAKEAGKRGGIYDTHQRDEASYSIGLLNSVKEALTIGKESGMPVHFAHIKALGPTVWGQSAGIIKLVDAARAAGQSVSADQYPYNANETSLQAQIIPSWALDGGYPALIKRFNDPATLEKIRAETTENLKRSNGPHAILFVASKQPWNGKYLDDVAKEWKVAPVDAAIRILRQTDKQAVDVFSMTPPDIDALLKQSWTFTGSDGADGHPRITGTYPTKYQEFVKRRKVISLGFFVRQSSGAIADFYKLDRRGYLRNGYYADIVVFDPVKYVAKSSYVDWTPLAEGVTATVINGKIAVDNGKMTDVLSGRPLSHTATPGSCL